jgi:hypothetical protein
MQALGGGEQGDHDTALRTLLAGAIRHTCCKTAGGNGVSLQRKRRRAVLHVAGYCGLILLEAVSFGASVSGQTGGSAVAATVLGILTLVPTANHCADRMFARLTRGSD